MRLLAAIGALVIVIGIGAATYFFGGYYSVAGTQEDPALVSWALVKVRTASIERHAKDVPSTAFNDPGAVQAGAKAFAKHGCANCHGAPGVAWQKFSEGMHPEAPDLKELVGTRSPGQLFWVIKNGINMTGMPAFSLAGAKDDEIWTIAAFLKKLPTVSEADYKSWTAPPPPPAPVAAPAPPAAAPEPPAAPAAPPAESK